MEPGEGNRATGSRPKRNGKEPVTRATQNENEHTIWPSVLFRSRPHPSYALGLDDVPQLRKVKCCSGVPVTSVAFHSPLTSLTQSINFQLQPGDLSVAQIQHLYREAKMEAVVEYVHDLQVVARYHIDKLMRMRCLYPCSTISTAFPSLCPPCSPLKSLADLAQLLRNTLEVLQETSVAETLGVMRVRGGDEVKPLVEFGPYPEWNTRVMLSKIAHIYLRKKPEANANDFHVPDYLLADHESLCKREAVFSDGKGLVLIREQIQSLCISRHVDKAVVNAFARVCNDLIMDRGWTSKVVFNLVAKEGSAAVEVKKVVNQMFDWIVLTMIQINKAIAFAFPLHKGSHYCLLMVDFKQGECVLYTTNAAESKYEWMSFARSVVYCFHVLLKLCADQRHAIVLGLPIRMVMTPWCVNGVDPDSGLATMNIWCTYGNPETHGLNLNQENVVMERRMSVCRSLAGARINCLRLELLSQVDRYVWEKSCGRIRPSTKMVKALGILAQF